MKEAMKAKKIIKIFFILIGYSFLVTLGGCIHKKQGVNLIPGYPTKNKNLMISVLDLQTQKLSLLSHFGVFLFEVSVPGIQLLKENRALALNALSIVYLSIQEEQFFIHVLDRISGAQQAVIKVPGQGKIQNIFLDPKTSQGEIRLS